MQTRSQRTAKENEPAKRTAKENEPAKRTAKENEPAKRTKLSEASNKVKITSSKACNAFATRVKQLETLVLATHPQCEFEINVEKKLSTKPDRGSFVVQVNDNAPIVELLAMPRPFTAMKSLDISDLSKQVVKQFKE